MSKTVALHTLGCKLNYSETSTLAEKFHHKGYKIRQYGEQSDIFVLNTCSVTDNADKECRQIIRSILSRNPETYVIVTGCYAQLQPHEIAAIGGVDVVLGTNEKFKLFDYIDNFEKHNLSCVFTSSVDQALGFDYAYSSDIDSRTRAFLKIQDGCDYNCSFCTIPRARGGSRSLPIDDVITNAKKLLDSGYKEIVLTGVNTGDYNSQLTVSSYQLTNSNSSNTLHLIDVLYELEKLNVPRIRISSIEPNLLNDEIIQLVKSSKNFCKHFHIPLQSGDPQILKLMRRRYNRDFYENLINKLNEEIPGIGIGVDVIVGFPGETNEMFENTFQFLQNLRVSYLHVFSYSERRGTDAAALPGAVDISMRKQRSAVLRELSNKKRFDFYSANAGKVHNTLFETVKEDGYIYGFTGNYIKVRTLADKKFENQILQSKINQTDSYLFAEAEVVSG